MNIRSAVIQPGPKVMTRPERVSSSQRKSAKKTGKEKNCEMCGNRFVGAGKTCSPPCGADLRDLGIARKASVKKAQPLTVRRLRDELNRLIRENPDLAEAPVVLVTGSWEEVLESMPISTATYVDRGTDCLNDAGDSTPVVHVAEFHPDGLTISTRRSGSC